MENQKRTEAIIKLSPENRYKHFIKYVSDWEVMYSLYDNGWALAENKNGKDLLPLWPSKSFAKLCKKDNWSHYNIKEISIYDFLEAFCSKLKTKNTDAIVFMTPRFTKEIIPAK